MSKSAMSKSAMSESAMSEDGAVQPWSPTRRMAFRFVFCYLALFIGPMLIGLLPFTARFSLAVNDGWQALAEWSGRHLFHLGAPALATVSKGLGGDTTLGALLLFWRLAMASLATSIWTLLDRRTLHYRRLDFGLRLAVRYLLAYNMLNYGALKVLKVQFGFPSGSRLAEAYGEASPMGLLWTFMGYSAVYTFFSGFVETASGLLLLFRRTSTAGALLAAAAMANVTAIDFSYDVWVKHWASHLLLFAIFLLAPDLPRLIDLLLNRPTPAVAPPQRLKPAWLHHAGRLANAVLVVALVAIPFKGAWDHWWPIHRPQPRRPSAAGPQPSYSVAQFLRSGKVEPSFPLDPNGWLWFVHQPKGAMIVTMSYAVLQGDYDAKRQVLVVYRADDEGNKQQKLGELACTRWGQNPMILTGRLGQGDITVVLRQFAHPAPLETASFHWFSDPAAAD